MLEFYQGQQKIQQLLAIFLDIYPYEYPNKGDLVALTNLQGSRLEFLIAELKNPASTLEASRRMWEDYCKSYQHQQRLLAPVVSAEYGASYLPDLVLPTPIEEEEELLAEGAVGLQLEELPAITSLPKLETIYYSQQPPVTTKNNKMDSPITQSGLVGAHSFFPLSEKTGETSKLSGKYALYEQKVQSLKERKDFLSIEEKQELRRLTNLLAAHNSRTRQKNRLRELETAVAENKKENKALQETHLRLTTEQQMLKKELAELMSMIAKTGVDPTCLLKHVMVSPVKIEEEEKLHKSFQPG